MGKASSAKKVARAARTGGARKRDRPKMAFPLAVFVVMVLGALLVVQARAAHEDDASASVAPSSLKKDHWHASYGLYVCDHFLPAPNDAIDDKLGIHTHGEGIIHIHPFSSASSGAKARLKVFTDQVGMTLFDDGFKTSDGTEYRNGFDCGGKPGKFAVYRYQVDDPTATVEVFEKDINNINFSADRAAYTIAILPEGANEPPPLPDSTAELDRLSDLGTPAGGTGDPSLTIPGGAGDPSLTIPGGAGDPSLTIPGGAVDPSLTIPGGDPGITIPDLSSLPASTPAVDPNATPSVAPTPAPSTP